MTLLPDADRSSLNFGGRQPPLSLSPLFFVWDERRDDQRTVTCRTKKETKKP